VQPRTVVLANDNAVPSIDCDHGVKGHRRALEEFDTVSGFRIYEVVTAPPPLIDLGVRQFGVSQGAAIPNLALVWPHRFTWHSDFQVRGARLDVTRRDATWRGATATVPATPPFHCDDSHCHHF
jgi:hypothetical protein